MEAYIRDFMIRMQCTSVASEFIANHESYSVSGNECKGEGGDFVLENLNRSSKSFMPPGMPSKERWKIIYRNMDRLDKIKSNLQTVLSLTEKDTDYMYTSDITDKITSFRTLIRQKQHFKQTTLTTLSNKPTDSKLLQFSEHAQQNKDIHYSHITTHKLSSRQKLTPIFILEEHRQKHSDIANKTKADFILHIQTRLNDSNTLFEKWKKK